MARKRPYPATILPARETASGTAIPAVDLRTGEIAVNSADGTLFIKREDGVVAPVGSVPTQVVSSGGLAALTGGQQAEVVTGTIVTTTDGKRWVYTGSGSKTAEASYIELADITPAWASIPDKPTTFTPATHSHAVADVTGLQTALDGKIPAAVEWTPNHTLADGTRYEIGDLVYSDGTVYRAIAANESMPVSSADYWAVVGAGYRLNIDGRDIANVPDELPASATDGDVLTYTSGQWTAAAPSGALPVGTEGYVLTYTGGAWVAAQPFSIGSGNSEGDVPTWSGAAQAYIPQQPSSGSSVFKGEWSSGVTYALGDFVEYSGVIYKSINAFSNPQPDTDPNYWAPIGGGGSSGTSTWKGVWDSGYSYNINDVVTYSQELYIAINPSNGTAPGTESGSYWDPLTGGGGGGASLPQASMYPVLAAWSNNQMAWVTSDDSMALNEIILGAFGAGTPSRAVVSFSPTDSTSPSIRVYDQMGTGGTELMATGVRFPDGFTQGNAFLGGLNQTLAINDGTTTHNFEFSNGVLTNYYTS